MRRPFGSNLRRSGVAVSPCRPPTRRSPARCPRWTSRKSTGRKDASPPRRSWSSARKTTTSRLSRSCDRTAVARSASRRSTSTAGRRRGWSRPCGSCHRRGMSRTSGSSAQPRLGHWSSLAVLSGRGGVRREGRAGSVSDSAHAESDRGEPMSAGEATGYRRIGARCNFRGSDRPDLQCAAKAPSRRWVASPCQMD